MIVRGWSTWDVRFTYWYIIKYIFWYRFLAQPIAFLNYVLISKVSFTLRRWTYGGWCETREWSDFLICPASFYVNSPVALLIFLFLCGCANCSFLLMLSVFTNHIQVSKMFPRIILLPLSVSTTPVPLF